MGAGPLVPVVLKDEGWSPLETDGTRFVLAGNGLFLERRTGLYTAMVRADTGVPGLLPQEAGLDLRVPALEPALLARIMAFFRAVHERWLGEAIVVLFYRTRDGDGTVETTAVAPVQTIRGRSYGGRFTADLHLEYGAAESPGPGWLKLGTFHSHSNVSPHHSSTDAHDELFETGLHLTAGYVDRPRPEFEVAFVVAGTRFPVAPETVLPPFRGIAAFPDDWLGRVVVIDETERRKDGATTWDQGYGGDAYGYGSYARADRGKARRKR